MDCQHPIKTNMICLLTNWDRHVSSNQDSLDCKPCVLQVEETIVNSLGQYLSHYVMNTISMVEGETPYIIPAKFCLEFVDLESFSNKHRAEIGNPLSRS
jgi:hypothetical protein